MLIDDKLVQKICDLYNIDKESIQPVNEHTQMFECTIQGQHFMLRLTGYKTFDEQYAETEFVNFLYQNGVGVAHAIPSKNGNLVEKLSVIDDDICIVLFSKAKGRIATTDEWNAELIEICGQTIGRMHMLSKNYVHPTKKFINDWHQQDEYNFQKHIPSKHSLVIKKCDSLFNDINKLPKDNKTYGLIHSDIWQGNFFVNGKTITIFDFQDCEQHYFINDLAIMIYFGLENSFNGNDINSYSVDFIRALLRGYAKECTIDPFWIEQIPLFLKLREMLSFTQIYCYEDIKSLTEDKTALLNFYRKNIEYDIPVLDIDFKSFCPE